MKKEYLDYKPLIKEEKKIKKKEVDSTKFVTKSTFELMFGSEYPKSYIKYHYVETIKYPKNNGSNGKNSRFR
tara:strand:- start:1069 stop:1284 length:216 start_codon:yes stop_codon:yes gene_type:complete